MHDAADDGVAGPSLEEARAVLDTAINPFVLMAPDGTVLWASASIEELLGHPVAAVVGRPMLELVAPGSRSDAVTALADALADSDDAAPAGWEGVGPVYAMLRADGSEVSCAVAAATPVRTGLDCFVLQLRRSDSSAALERLHLSMGSGEPLEDVLSLVAAVLEGELPDADVVLYHFDREQERLVAASRRPTLADAHDLPALLGEVWWRAEMSEGEVLNLPVAELPAAAAAVAEEAGYRWAVLHAIDPLTDDDRPGMVTVWSRSPHRTHMLNHERVIRCGRLLGVALKNEWGRRALEWAATHDILTGLHNRASFLAELAALQTGSRKTDPSAVLYLDLDDFKPVNEQYGHPLGDRVLVKIAERLRHLIRPTDLVARFGGDEFAVLCPGLDDRETVEKLADRLVAEIHEPIEIDGHEIAVGLSIGIALVNPAREDDDVIARADRALRQAKADGKARWHVAS